MQYILWLFFIIVCLVVLLKVFSTLISLYYGSPSGETTAKLAKYIFQEINLGCKDTLVDLGSGLGNTLLVASKIFKARSIGYEISPLPYIISKMRTIKNKNIQIIQANIFEADIKKATVIFCYLLPKLLASLAPKLKSACQTGAIIISPVFQIKGLKLDKKILFRNKIIYVYKI